MSVDSANNSKLLKAYSNYMCELYELDQKTNELSTDEKSSGSLEDRIRSQAREAALKGSDSWLQRVNGDILRLKELSIETIKASSINKHKPKQFETESSLEDYSKEFASIIKEICKEEIQSQQLKMIDFNNSKTVAKARAISEKLDSVRQVL